LTVLWFTVVLYLIYSFSIAPLVQFPYCLETDVATSRNYWTDEWCYSVLILQWNVEIL